MKILCMCSNRLHSPLYFMSHFPPLPCGLMYSPNPKPTITVVTNSYHILIHTYSEVYTALVYAYAKTGICLYTCAPSREIQLNLSDQTLTINTEKTLQRWLSNNIMRCIQRRKPTCSYRQGIQHWVFIKKIHLL